VLGGGNLPGLAGSEGAPVHSYTHYAAWKAAADAADAHTSTEVAGTTPEEMRQRAGTMLFLGNPPELVTLFKQRQEEAPITGTIMRVPPGMEHKKVLRCMELVAREVMPHFAD
jgi:hypothetical protein